MLLLSGEPFDAIGWRQCQGPQRRSPRLKCRLKSRFTVVGCKIVVRGRHPLPDRNFQMSGRGCVAQGATVAQHGACRRPVEPEAIDSFVFGRLCQHRPERENSLIVYSLGCDGPPACQKCAYSLRLKHMVLTLKTVAQPGIQ